MLVPAILGGCAPQPPYQRPAVAIPERWANAPDAAPVGVVREDWWTLFGDPAIDQLVAGALSDNPTLAEALARVDQARAALAAQDARRIPGIGAVANAGAGSATADRASATMGLSLSWEVDLWGRVRESGNAARHRLSARAADAEAARLSIISEIADTVLALRACYLVHGLRAQDIASRETELAMIRTRLQFGQAAPVAVATAETNLAVARTDRIAQDTQCRTLANALVALSGLDAAEIARLLPGDGAGDIPLPPPFAPELPATVLLHHPAILAAEREVAARWSDIAVARAERLPRLDLTALLTGQWLRAFGSSDASISGSVGAGLTAPLIDGGAGAANVRFAEAAYREAVARLVFTVRTAVRDIEDALAAQQSAAQRIETSQAALEAARFTLTANQARLRLGSIAPFELEEARRQFNRAQESAILASTDLARAWVALVRRTGGAFG